MFAAAPAGTGNAPTIFRKEVDRMPGTKKLVRGASVARAPKLDLVGRARAEVETLVKDARRVGTGVQKRAERAMYDLEHRAERIFADLEARAVKAVAPVLRRTFATQREVRELRTMVVELARKVDDLARRPAA
jgi:hypothetical protein